MFPLLAQTEWTNSRLADTAPSLTAFALILFVFFGGCVALVKIMLASISRIGDQQIEPVRQLTVAITSLGGVVQNVVGEVKDGHHVVSESLHVVSRECSDHHELNQHQNLQILAGIQRIEASVQANSDKVTAHIDMAATKNGPPSGKIKRETT